MFQIDNHVDSSQDDDEDLPPPPPPSLPPPISTPNKINYLTAVTPKPYKSPFAMSNGSTPIPPPLSFEGNQLRDSPSPISSVSLSLSRPRSVDLDSKDINRRSLASQIANFALSDDPSSSKETRELPWLKNNSQGTSPLERSSSSESESNGREKEETSGACGDGTKESSWSVSDQHAEKRILGSSGFSLRQAEEPVKTIVDSDKDDTESDNNNTGQINGSQSEKGVHVASEKTKIVSVSPKVSIGGASSARSSKSIAKMILSSRKNSESNNQQEESDKIKNDSDYVNVVPVKDQVSNKKEKIQSLYDAEDPSKLVPLTFRRSDEDDDSDENTEIVARKENKSPDKNVTFAIVEESNNNTRSAAMSKESKQGDNKYHLVRAEPFVEGEHKGFKGPRSSKSIANMILNGKKDKQSNGEMLQKKTNHILTTPQLKSE